MRDDGYSTAINRAKKRIQEDIEKNGCPSDKHKYECILIDELEENCGEDELTRGDINRKVTLLMQEIEKK